LCVQTISAVYVNAASFVSDYDALLHHPRMRALYGDSGYFNVGYWAEGVASLRDACDRLVDELAASIPPEPDLIIDVGCGLGAGTRRLADRFPGALVVGGNLSHWQLLQTRSRGVEAVVAMDAARLPFATGCATAVTAIESPQHFDTRSRFLAEARRVLQPGGILAMADMLFHERAVIGDWMLPAANQVQDLAAYEALLGAAGFEAVHVRDATDICWQPFCDAMRPLLEGQSDRLDALRRSVSHYVLAIARVP
jgi:MPBQ/MSBQ methyltransferase